MSDQNPIVEAPPKPAKLEIKVGNYRSLSGKDLVYGFAYLRYMCKELESIGIDPANWFFIPTQEERAWMYNKPQIKENTFDKMRQRSFDLADAECKILFEQGSRYGALGDWYKANPEFFVAQQEVPGTSIITIMDDLNVSKISQEYSRIASAIKDWGTPSDQRQHYWQQSLRKQAEIDKENAKAYAVARVALRSYKITPEASVCVDEYIASFARRKPMCVTLDLRPNTVEMSFEGIKVDKEIVGGRQLTQALFHQLSEPITKLVMSKFREVAEGILSNLEIKCNGITIDGDIVKTMMLTNLEMETEWNFKTIVEAANEIKKRRALDKLEEKLTDDDANQRLIGQVLAKHHFEKSNAEVAQVPITEDGSHANIHDVSGGLESETPTA